MKNLSQRSICSSGFMYNVSILRIVAMLMVIFYHSFYCYVGWDNSIYCSTVSVGLWSILSSLFSHIHVPTFLFLAGYLYAYKRFGLKSYSCKRKYLVNRAKRLGIPYALWGGILMLLQNRPLTQFFDGIAHLWFLLVLAECCLLFCLIDTVFLRFKNNVAILILAMLYLAIDNKITLDVNFASLGVFIHYFPYYLIGILVYLINLEQFLKWKSVWVVLMVFLCYLVSVRIGYFANCFSVLLITFVFLYAKKINKESNKLHSIDKASMGIYILHQPLIQETSLTHFVADFRDEHFYMYPLLMFVFAFTVSYVLVNIARKLKVEKFIFG